MKTRLTLNVDDHARLVIAKYFAPVSHGADRTRTRATRAQVRRFAEAAVATAVREHATVLRGRTLAAAYRLLSGNKSSETLAPPDGWQQGVLW